MNSMEVEIVAIVFTFTTIIVLAAIIGDIFKKRIKAKERSMPDEFFEEFDRRLQRVEDRLANIETIVLEKEKHKKFAVL